MKKFSAWTMVSLMILSATSLPAVAQGSKVKFCFLFCTIEEDVVPVVSDFCSQYTPVVVDEGDTKGMGLNPRRRVLGNELRHFCLCPVKKVNHPRCVGVK